MRMTAREVAAAVGGAVVGHGDVVLTGAEVDSRRLAAGDLFVALPGTRRDGHEFVAEALRVAAAALVRRDASLEPPPDGRALVRVPDTLAAYHGLARRERDRRSWRVVAVSGSVGKTTTKEMLAGLLSAGFAVGASAGNRNSTLGLPAELLSQPEEVETMVAEAGMSRAGELDVLGAIVRPDVLVYTRITPAHVEFFDGIEGIVEAKAELLSHVAASGTVVLNAGDPRQRGFAARARARSLRYLAGAGEADVRVRVLEDRGLAGCRVVLELPDGVGQAELAVPGLHQVENLAAAAAGASAVGLDAASMVDAVGNLRAAARRGAVHATAAGLTVVDDSYNASPVAVERMLELLARTPGRRVAVLGEMYELGTAAPAAHAEAGRRAAASCDLLLAVGGNHARAMAAAAREAGLSRVEWASDVDAAILRLGGLLEPGDVVLLKGSRGVNLDRAADALVDRGDG